MFAKNDKALLTTRIVVTVLVGILAVGSFVAGIVLAILWEPLYFLIVFAGWFLCWCLWVVARLYLSYLVDVKLIRNKLYGTQNDDLNVFLKEGARGKIEEMREEDADRAHWDELLSAGTITKEACENGKLQSEKDRKTRDKALQWIVLAAAVLTLASFAFSLASNSYNRINGFGALLMGAEDDDFWFVSLIAAVFIAGTLVLIGLSLFAAIKPISPATNRLAKRILIACCVVNVVYMAAGIVFASLWDEGTTTGAYGAVLLNGFVTALYCVCKKFYREIGALLRKRNQDPPPPQP